MRKKIDKFDRLNKPLDEAEMKDVVVFARQRHPPLYEHMVWLLQAEQDDQIDHIFGMAHDDMCRIRAGFWPRWIPYQIHPEDNIRFGRKSKSLYQDLRITQ